MSDHEQHDEKEHKKHSGHGGHGHGGGHEEGHEGAPEWLISFADNVTLMMGFFVILLAVNMGPKGAGAGDLPQRDGDSERPPPALLDAQIAIREAFNNPVNLNSMDPKERALVQRLMERRGKANAKQDGPRGDEHNLQSIRPSNYYKTCGAVPFDDNSTELTPAARATVADIAAHMRGLRIIIEVRGHASAREVFQLPDHGMRLSFDRAHAVGTELTHHGIEWRQIRVIALADNDRRTPIIYGKNGHQPNERVEVVLSDEVMPDYAPTSAPAKSASPSH